MRLVDCRHLGRERVIGAWLVGDALVDPGPTTCVDALLEGLAGERPRRLLLTHIHLDHAGAAGTLARRWPGLEVWVHRRGARHLADPSRLVASATRLYGEEMDRLWGEVAPVPEDRLRVLEGGERLPGFRVAETLGHASHHVAYLHADSGRAFCGDVAGVRIPPQGVVLPPTPPPDIDLEAWRRSIDVLEAWQPSSLAVTHFGAWDDVPRHLGELRAALDRAERRARELDREAFVEWARSLVDDPAYHQAMPPDQLWQGLARYLERSAS